MNGTRLLILGGSRYNVLAIQAARAAGFFTLVADRDPKAPGLKVADCPLNVNLTDEAALLSSIQECGGIHGIVSMAEPGVRPAAAISEQLGLPGISRDAAASATSKAAMRQRWSALGKYSVDFRVASTSAQAMAAVQQLGRFPLIFKPDRSFGGSRGVSRVVDENQVAEAFQFAQAGALPNSAVVVERCVEGSEHSAEVLIWQGRTSVLCIGEKVKSPAPYRVDLSVRYPASLSAAKEAAVADMCHAAVTALGLTQGVAHVEFAMTPDGPVLFELGARCGGGHTPRIAAHVSGLDEFVEVCRMACGTPPQGFCPLEKRGADYRFLIFPPGRVANVHIPEAVQRHPSILDVDISLAPGDECRSLRTTADRAGFLVSLADKREAAVAAADWACEQIGMVYVDGNTARANIHVQATGTP